VIRRIVLALAAATLLAGCAAGPNAVTLKQYTPTDGNQASTGSINVLNLVLVAGSDEGASLIATIVNSGATADSLQTIAVNGVPMTIVADTLDLLQDRPMIFGGESATASATVNLSSVKPGQLVPVEIYFTQAGLISTTALVREPTLEFAPTDQG